MVCMHTPRDESVLWSIAPCAVKDSSRSYYVYQVGQGAVGQGTTRGDAFKEATA